MLLFFHSSFILQPSWQQVVFQGQTAQTDDNQNKRFFFLFSISILFYHTSTMKNCHDNGAEVQNRALKLFGRFFGKQLLSKEVFNVIHVRLCSFDIHNILLAGVNI